MLRKNATFFGGIMPLHPGYITNYGEVSIYARKETQVKNTTATYIKKTSWMVVLVIQGERFYAYR